MIVGTPLLSSDLDQLRRCGIDPSIAEAAGLRRVDSFTGGQIVGRNGNSNYEGIIFPYRWPGEPHAREYRLRRDEPEMERGSDGRLKPKDKYLSPPGRGNMLYFAPGTRPEWLDDGSIPIILSEGEKKCLAISELAWHGIRDSAEKPRLLPVSIAGVWNWRGTIGKVPGPNGERLDEKGPIPDLDRIAWKGRQSIIVFDSNVRTNPSVQAARRMLAAELGRRGAHVRYVDIPADAGVNGIDDLIGAWGKERVLEFIQSCAYDPKMAGGWESELIRTERQAPRALLANCLIALRKSVELRDVLGFNEFSHSVVAREETPWGAAAGTPWSDHQDALACEWLQSHRIHVSVEVSAQAVQTVAQQRPFHPLREWLSNLKWDGRSRIHTWLRDYLGVEDSDYSRQVGMRWPISAVARVFRPGVKADCCLILEGPQGIKKSTALKTLAGEYFTDELADLGSKDAALQTRGVWIVELAELDSLSKSEVSRIKAFMSRSSDRFRPPYGRRVIESPRQCVFAGTVNHTEYLRDETGARRFWPVLCGSIDIEALERDRDQLWAEAKASFDAGAVWWLDSAELINAAAKEQAARYEEDAWDSLVRNWTALRADVSIPEVLTGCIGKAKEQWTQTDKNRVARCLRAAGWKRYYGRTDTTETGREWRYRRAK